MYPNQQHNLGAVQGAAAVRRSAKKNPVEALVSLIDGDPTADVERLFRKWLEIVRDDEELLIPALRHCFTNIFSSLEAGRRRNRQMNLKAATEDLQAHNERQIQRVKAQQQTAKSMANVIMEIILLDLKLPNGKLLRDATFKDCASAGGWYAKVAKRGRPSQIVGQTLTEQQLRAI